MMRTLDPKFGCALVLALLAGCEAGDQATLGDGGLAAIGDLAGGEERLGPGPEVACGRRQVGLRVADRCADGRDGWRLEPPIAVAERESELGARLARYCIYEWTRDALPDLQRRPRGAERDDWLSGDCHAVAAMTELDEVVAPGLNEAYHYAAGVELPFPRTRTDPERTLVAVVDTLPRGFDQGRPGTGNYDHGRNVGLAIRRLTCPQGGPCLSDIANHLGLPRVAPERADPVGGGFFAYQTEVALGILSAVEAWRQSDRQNQHARLVINLSLGWGDRFGGPYPGNDVASLAPHIRLVHDAIAYARCQGALVIAAAGNRAYEGDEDDLLYPAGWARKPGPTAQTCRGLTPHGDPAFAPGVDDPLVLAVAGLNADDRPLWSARLDSRTEIEAIAYHVTEFDGELGAPSPVLSGSSLAAATASAVAAAVWAYAPSLAPAEVAQILYDSGEDLSPAPGGGVVQADACLAGAPCRTVHRISMCDAIALACARAGTAACPANIECHRRPAYESARATLDAAAEAALATVPLAAEVDATGAFDHRGKACGRTIFVTGSAPPDYPCVERPFAGAAAAPWASPQPGWNGCDICMMKDTSAYLRINPSDDLTVRAKYSQLVFEDSKLGTLTYDLTTLDPSLTSLTPGLTYKVVGVPIGADVTTAKINYVVSGDQTAESLVADEVYLY